LPHKTPPNPAAVTGRNLVYSAPTSGGKSLVAEVLLLRRVLRSSCPALLVLPYVAVCEEKAAALDALLAPARKTVRRAYAGLARGKLLEPDTGAGASLQTPRPSRARAGSKNR